MPALQRKDGTPTAYAMACGYTMNRHEGDVRTELWREGSIYHVRRHDNSSGSRVFWKSFTTYNTARKAFNS